jgi:hypothetical protein
MENYNDEMTGDENSLNIYDEAGQRAERAFRAFRALYEVQNPQPKESSSPALPIQDDKPSVADKPIIAPFVGNKQRGMIAGLLGSVIVSASHVIPVFLNKPSIYAVSWFSFEAIVGLSIFTMMELGLVTYAYSSVENSPTSESAKKVQWITNKGLYFILTIAVMANIYYVLQSSTSIAIDFSDVWGWVRIVIFLFIGTSAPLTALMTGDILAMDVLRHRANARRDIQLWEEKLERDLEAWRTKTAREYAQWESKCEAIKADYDSRLNQWNEGLKQSWDRNKAKWDGAVNIQVAKPEPARLSLSEQTDSRQTKSGMGYGRLSNATDEAYQWLIDNPDSQAKTVRELAEIIGVGKDSVAKAKKRLSE